MLRRVARALRITLLVVGCALVVWLPGSFIYGISLILPWPGAYGSVTMFSGKLSFSTRQENTFIRFDSAQVDVFERRSPLLITPQHLLPSYNSSQVPDPGTNGVVWQRTLTLPLWLLAFLCLAWPVASLIAQRRQKRGFPVSVAPLPLGEVPSDRSE